MLSTESIAPAVEAIQKAIEEGGSEAAATLYVQQDGFISQQAFGAAPGLDAVFLISSITKSITAMGVMILADRGKISLDDRVMNYLPEFQGEDRPQVTIRQLLSHNCGLPNHPEPMRQLLGMRAPEEAFFQLACLIPLDYVPGSKVKYQNVGYILAGEIIQRVSGMRLRDFLEKEIFLPMGMSKTTLGLGTNSPSNVMATPVEFWNTTYYRDLGTAWGGAHSSAADIATLLSIPLTRRSPILSSEAIAEMIRNQTYPRRRHFGLGWMLGSKRFGGFGSEETFGHHGATGAVAWADPCNGLLFVLLTNLPAGDALPQEASGGSRMTLLKPVSDMVSKAAVS